MEENVRKGFYRPSGATCRDSGRFQIVRSEVDRFWSKVDLSHPQGCWVWLRGRNGFGYGRFTVTVAPGVQRDVLAHRYAYELVVAPIPEGLTLDHLCEQPACVRPSHLEPVPNSVNLRRRHARRRTQGVSQ